MTSKQENPLVVKFREACLKRGDAGIKGIAILWASLDDDRSRTLTLDEFQKGIINHNITMTKDEVSQLFKLFDKNGNGSIDYEEFITALRPPMSNSRVALVTQAYQKLDKNRDGKVTAEDLVGVFNVKKHAKYLNGEWSEKQIINSFLETFEIGQHKDGVVTFEEFLLYYSGVSASIDSDAYFDVMMRNSWKI